MGFWFPGAKADSIFSISDGSAGSMVLGRWSSSIGWARTLAVAAALLIGFIGKAGAQEASTTQPAAAAAATPEAAPDPIGFNGGPTTPLLQPNSYLSGWVSGSADKNLDAVTGGTFKPWAGEKPTVEELGQHTAKMYYSM